MRGKRCKELRAWARVVAQDATDALLEARPYLSEEELRRYYQLYADQAYRKAKKGYQ